MDKISEGLSSQEIETEVIERDRAEIGSSISSSGLDV